MSNMKTMMVAGSACCVMLMGFACSSNGDNDDGDTSTQATGTGGNATTTTGEGASTTTTTTGDGGGLLTSVGGSDAGSGGSCVDIEVVAEQTVLPADIIFMIDNSGSMGQEIASVEQNINVNFAQIIANSGIDYQVIMVTNHGSASTHVCIGPPLSNSANCNGAPGDVAGQFHHYDVDVQSWDSLCIALDTLYGPNNGGAPDQHSLHPEGWSKWLRQQAIKVFVEITDDDINCTWNGTNLNDNGSPQSPTGPAAMAAINFDSLLLQQAPAQFGTTAARNYQFYSIVGIQEKANPLDPYQPGEPVAGSTLSDDCSTASGPGWGYQWLSKGTGGLRFPVCQFSSYDAVFQAIAAGVVSGASVPCEFDISGNQEPIDPNSLIVEYTPGGMGPLETFAQVMGSAACGVNDQGFYLEGDLVKLCPSTCDKVTADQDAGLKVVAQCTVVPD